MRDTIKISVIVPVFNIAPYITKCIESLQRQTFTDMEIILVDDGSTDESGKICDDFSKKDARIIVIHKENEGLSSARNAGIDVARGKYLGFVDGDDWVDETMYQELYDLAESEHAQIVSCGYQGVYDEGVVENTKETNSVTVFNNRDALKQFFLREITESVCDKLFLKELFSDLKFLVGEINEDTVMVANLLMRSQKTVLSERKLYFYRKREGSITKSGYSKRFRVVDKHIKQIAVLTNKRYPELKSYMAYFFGVHYYCLLLSILKDPNGKQFQKDYQYYLRQFQKFFGAFMKWGTGKQKDRILAILLVCRCGKLLYSRFG